MESAVRQHKKHLSEQSKETKRMRERQKEREKQKIHLCNFTSPRASFAVVESMTSGHFGIEERTDGTLVNRWRVCKKSFREAGSEMGEEE